MLHVSGKANIGIGYKFSQKEGGKSEESQSLCQGNRLNYEKKYWN